MQARTPILALLVSLMAYGCSLAMPGQKLLSLEVYQGDELVLQATFDVPDSYSESQIWDASGEEPWSMNRELPPLQPTQEDPSMVRLDGGVELRILHTKNLETSATLDGLTLTRTTTRSSDPEPGWRLPPTEISRAKQAAGL